MQLEKVVSELSGIERKALSALASAGRELSSEELSELAGIDLDSSRRAIQWLSEKGLGKARIKKSRIIELGKEGLKVLGEGMIERKLIQELSEGNWGKLSELKGIPKNELSIALGQAKRKEWIEIRKEKELEVKISGKGLEELKGEGKEEELIKKIGDKGIGEAELSEEERKVLSELQKRMNFIRVREKGSEFISITGEGIKGKELMGKAGERKYNIQEPVAAIFPGKRHPYIQFLNQIRSTLIRLGFKEMQERLITQEFYSFDVLFQPQNHPARDWADTYKLKRPEYGKLPDKKFVSAVKNAHENGGKTKSKGWGYEWSERIASQLMPNAHGTTADARQMIEGVEIPGKYFVINRCYRPDVLDATHAVEFNQLDGFIVGEKINFRHLLGILKEITREITGTKKVKFTTGYFPFTEPSCEVYIKHPKLGWIEVGGAGIFRPEVTAALGIQVPAIAWGLGIERLAMIRLGIKDVRELFSSDLNWLRKKPLINV